MKNPFDFKRNMDIHHFGITINGNLAASIAYDVLAPQQPLTADPFAGPEDERWRFARRAREEESALRRAEAHGRRYQQSVIDLLTKLRATATGRAVLDAIAREATETGIVIVPWVGKVGEPPNASARKDIIPGQRERLFGPNPAFVRFTPAHWHRNDDLAALYKDIGIGVNEDWGPGALPDEVLLHELVHALFINTGKSLKRRVPFQGRRYLTGSWSEKHPDWRGPYEMDEFMAIMITNIYRSEQKRDYVRHSHTDHQAHALSDEAFLDIGMNRAHVRLLRRKQPQLFNALNDVEAAWNPLRSFRDSVLQ